MRKVKIMIGGIPSGEQQTWAYPNGQPFGRYLVPIYKYFVEGVDAGNVVKVPFDVLRFGVLCNDGKTASVVGLSDYQAHIIKAWIPTYCVHSANSMENGAWASLWEFFDPRWPRQPH